MKLVLKVVILFLIVFNWRIPIVYNSVFLSIFITTLYYFYERKSIPFTYFSYRYIVTIIVATLLLVFVTFIITTLHGTGFWGGTAKRFLVQLYMLCALIYALPIFFDGKESEAYEEAIVIICYIFALQGLIHTAGYLIPSVGDWLLSIKTEQFLDLLYDPGRNIDVFRGYALSGTIFFELPSAYGAAFILFMRMQLKEGQNYITGYKSYFIASLMVIGIMLSGRVGFVGIGMGIVLYFIFVKDPLLILMRGLKVALAFMPVLLIVYFFILSPSQQLALQTDIFPFAFEFFYNFVETGELRTWSSDVTLKAFYYPLREETLLWGHGVDNVNKMLYMYSFTDAGYMRNLFMGGIPFLLCLLIYQYLFFSKPISIAAQKKERENKIDRYCFLFLYIYILILHIKDNALGLQHLTEVIFLYAGFSYLVKYYAQLEE